MKRKKAICLLVVMAILMGMWSLVVQTVKVKKPVSGTESYSYITKEEYDIVRNNSLIKVDKTSYILSLEALYLDGLELNIYVLLQDIDRKACRVSINAEKQYVEEICLTPKKYTAMKIAILNNFDDKNIELHIGMMCMGTGNAKLLDIVVTMGEHVTEHSFQVSFLNKLMMRMFFCVVTIFSLCFYEGNIRISQPVYIIHRGILLEYNMKQYSKVFQPTPFVIAEKEESIQQLLIWTDWVYLILNEKWIIITYATNRSKKVGCMMVFHLPQVESNEATINNHILGEENYDIVQKNFNPKEYEDLYID